MLTKIISGGQTGVDRAALDVALELGLPCGGWCPRGRRAEDGVIPDYYPLAETPRQDYSQRTEWNVRDSDGTLIFVHGSPDRGTALTIRLAGRYRKPLLIVDLSAKADVASVQAWANTHHIHVLNVAGPRESSCPGVYARAVEILRQVFTV